MGRNFVKLGLSVIVLTIIADQISKFFVSANLSEELPVAVTGFFNWVKVWNTGVSFSMFNNHGQTGVIVLSLFALGVAAFLFSWMIKEKNELKIAALALIIGGALGNVIDRVRFGAVLDFLDFHYQKWHWPAFNLADSFICVGVFILIVIEIFENKKKKIEEV